MHLLLLKVLYRAKRTADLNSDTNTEDEQKSTERKKIFFPVWDDANGEYREDEEQNK